MVGIPAEGGSWLPLRSVCVCIDSWLQFIKEFETSVQRRGVSGDWGEVIFRDIMLALRFCFIRRPTFSHYGHLGSSTEGGVKKEML